MWRGHPRPLGRGADAGGGGVIPPRRPVVPRGFIVAQWRALTRRAGGGETELSAERVRLFFRKTDNGWKLIRIESPELRFGCKERVAFRIREA